MKKMWKFGCEMAELHFPIIYDSLRRSVENDRRVGRALGAFITVAMQKNAPGLHLQSHRVSRAAMLAGM